MKSKISGNFETRVNGAEISWETLPKNPRTGKILKAKQSTEKSGKQNQVEQKLLEENVWVYLKKFKNVKPECTIFCIWKTTGFHIQPVFC